LGGLSKVMPITFFSALIAALSISGVPPFNGFFSKWMVYQGLIENARAGGRLWMFCIVSAMFGSGLTLASFIKLIHAIFLGKAKTRQVVKSDVHWTMWISPVILSVLCVVFGVFAYTVPVKHLIMPVLPDGFRFIGMWPTLKTTLFLATGLGIGVLIYLLGNFKGIRETGSYIGGEETEEDMRLSGTEFYNTIKELPLIRGLYRKAERKAFDLYEVGKRFIFVFIRIFQYLHNGVLPSYLVWCLLGIMVFLFAIVR
jgi:NADH:ubiquinone oxidoreductase subunit 5 (subunit L)/multisubunit Na+/H+ antiporter MnhA subunit